MAWQELIDRRTRSSRTYQDGNTFRYLSPCGVSINTPSAVDASDFNNTVDFALQRVNTSKLNGFQITEGDYLFSIQTQPKAQAEQEIGTWVFSGRKGSADILIRLEDMGYLHWPTRAFQGLGAINYDPLNLTVENTSIPFGPINETVNLRSFINWVDLWSFGGGGVNLLFNIDNNRLKSDLIVSETARSFIRTNLPPITPPTETYLGFRFSVDVSNLGRIRRLIDQVEFTDDMELNGEIELDDSLNRLIAFMPVDSLFGGSWVRGQGPNQVHIETLRRRLYLEGGKVFLFVGVQVDIVNGMPVGQLKFDPTFGPIPIAANTDDGTEENTTWHVSGYRPTGGLFLGKYYADTTHFTGVWWDNITVAAGSTVTAAQIIFQSAASDTSTTVNVNIWADAADDPVQFGAQLPSAVKTAGGTANSPIAWNSIPAWNNNENGADTTTPDLTAIIQDIIDRAGWNSGQAMRFAFGDNGSSNNANRTGDDFSNTSAVPPTLTITYTAGGAGATNLIPGSLPMMGVGR